MTEHINAREGIKKVYTGEVIAIVSIFASIAAALLTLIPLVGTIIGAIIAVGVLVLDVIAFIMQLVGLNKAGKDAQGYKTAFTIIIVSLIITVVLGIISTAVSVPLINDIANVVVMILDLLVINKIIFTSNDLLAANGKSEISEKGESVWKLIMGLLIASIILAIVAIILTAFSGGGLVIGLLAILATIASIVVSIIQLVAYFKYIGYLKAAYPNL